METTPYNLARLCVDLGINVDAVGSASYLVFWDEFMCETMTVMSVRTLDLWWLMTLLLASQETGWMSQPAWATEPIFTPYGKNEYLKKLLLRQVTWQPEVIKYPVPVPAQADDSKFCKLLCEKYRTRIKNLTNLTPLGITHTTLKKFPPPPVWGASVQINTTPGIGIHPPAGSKTISVVKFDKKVISKLQFAPSMNAMISDEDDSSDASDAIAMSAEAVAEMVALVDKEIMDSIADDDGD